MKNQLEKEIAAVKTVLDVSKFAIGASEVSAEEKSKVAAVLEDVYTMYIGKIIGHYAMTIAIRSEKDANVRARLATRTETEIAALSAFIKK